MSRVALSCSGFFSFVNGPSKTQQSLNLIWILFNSHSVHAAPLAQHGFYFTEKKRTHHISEEQTGASSYCPCRWQGHSWYTAAAVNAALQATKLHNYLQQTVGSKQLRQLTLFPSRKQSLVVTLLWHSPPSVLVGTTYKYHLSYMLTHFSFTSFSVF